MKHIVWPGVLALTMLTSGTAWNQQIVSPPQEAVAFPQVTPAGPDLAATMKALEAKLRGRDRIDWTQNVSSWQRRTFWEVPTSVSADPKTCSLRIISQTSEGLSDFTFYLEQISEVNDVLTSEDFIHRYRHNHITAPGYPTDYQENVQPRLYSVGFHSWTPFDIKFSTKDAAEQASALLRESVKQCSSAPITPRPSDGPGLAETLSFIADKLKSQGQVASKSTASPLHGGEGVPLTNNFELSIDYFQVSSNPTTCTLSIGGDILSSRRISKIEVLKSKDHFARLLARDYPNATFQISETHPFFVLDIKIPGGDSRYLFFSDETLANRVAKAMVHAAELCGAGSNREPF